MRSVSKRSKPRDLVAGGGLPADAYLSGERLAVEQAAIIGPSWQPVCYESDLPKVGSYLTADCGGEPTVLVRQRDGTIRALSAVCLHRGGPVAQGCGTASSLRCIYHGWRYDLTGALIDQPDDAAALTPWRLPTFEAMVVPPFVFVSTSGDTPAPTGFVELKAALESRGYTRELRRQRSTYVVRANWKLVVENFLECVHCPFVHPSTVARSLDLDRYDFEIEADYIRYQVVSTGATATRPIFAIYPNMAFSILPGLVVTFHAMPVDAQTTRVVRDFLSMDSGDALPDDRLGTMLDYFNAVMLEDVRLVEAVQRNMRSRVYQPGGYLPGEAPLRFFHRRLASDLAAAGASVTATANGGAACARPRHRPTGEVDPSSPPPVSPGAGS